MFYSSFVKGHLVVSGFAMLKKTSCSGHLFMPLIVYAQEVFCYIFLQMELYY
jgi:hypothetical protein